MSCCGDLKAVGINHLKEGGKSKGLVVRPLRVSRLMNSFFAAILVSKLE